VRLGVAVTWQNPWFSPGDVVSVVGAEGEWVILRSWPTGKRNPPFTFDLARAGSAKTELTNIRPADCMICDEQLPTVNSEDPQ
jgi:hypothetical protein